MTTEMMATQKGFYGRMIEAGERFTVAAGVQGSWFEPVVRRPAVEQPALKTPKRKVGDDLV